MKIRKFRAADSQSALRQIRQAVGPDAEILASYPVTDGIEFLVSGEPVTVETTALPLPVRRGIEALVAAPRPAPAVAAAMTARREPVMRDPRVAHESVTAREPVVARESVAPRAPAAMPRAIPRAVVPAPAPSLPADDELVSLRHELGSMRHLLEQHLRLVASGGEPVTATSGLQAELRAALALAPQPALPGEPLLTTLQRALPVRRVPTQGVVLLVGPTGAGKTALLTRLLAQAAIAGEAGDVAVINTDASAPGAGEPLRAYARLLGVRCLEAADDDTLATQCEALAGSRLVLIDTAGFTGHDAASLTALRTLQAALPQAECLLVLPADRERAALDALAEQAQALPLTGLVVTRLDEATRLDAVAALAIRHRLPLTWTSDAPRHPQGVQVASAEAFIARLATLADVAEAAPAAAPHRADAALPSEAVSPFRRAMA